jgi:hypothetical protein
MTQSYGPMSLPLDPAPQHPMRAVIKQPPAIETTSDSGLAMSRSCDCLTQTEISAVLTPRNEQMPPDPRAQFLQQKPPGFQVRKI